jgi:hypothetical protein
LAKKLGNTLIIVKKSGSSNSFGIESWGLAVPRPPEEYRVNTGGKRGPYKNKKPE